MSSSNFTTPEQLNRYFAKNGGYKSLLEREEKWDENMLSTKVASYIKEYHPSVPFFFDMSGYHLSKSSANKASAQRADLFKVPDLVVLVKKGNYGMLAIELKIAGTILFKKDGGFVKNAHLEGQRDSILRLRKYGQCADFGIGYKDVIEKVNSYLEKGEINYTLR